jgi:hypothetical protein
MSQTSAPHNQEPTWASPAATGPAGPLFEGQVGAYYLLSMLAGGEPRGLPGTTVTRIEFQRASDRPLDDVIVLPLVGKASRQSLKFKLRGLSTSQQVILSSARLSRKLRRPQPNQNSTRNVTNSPSQRKEHQRRSNAATRKFYHGRASWAWPRRSLAASIRNGSPTATCGNSSKLFAPTWSWRAHPPRLSFRLILRLEKTPFPNLTASPQDPRPVSSH